MKTMVISSSLVLALASVTFVGCKEEPTSETPPSRTTPSQSSTPATPSTPSGTETRQTTPTADTAAGTETTTVKPMEDYRQQASKEITSANAESELSKLEKDIAADQ